MNNLKLERNDWQTHVPYSGWYAWKYAENIFNDAVGITWFEIQEYGTERFVSYSHMGNCHRQQASQPLNDKMGGILVCPVDITKKGEDVPVTKALRGMLEDWLDQFGPEACDCRPEPENQGHVCNVCMAKMALNYPCAWDHAE